MNNEKKMDFFDVLLVEDNAADILLLQEVLKDTDFNINLHVVNNGEDAMSFLHRIEPFTDAVRPDLVLLDLNLPRKNGFAVLEEIKQDSTLREIPVIILSTSQAQEDVSRSYQLHANCYICKPSDLGRFMSVIKNITKYWLDTVSLPG